MSAAGMVLHFDLKRALRWLTIGRMQDADWIRAQIAALGNSQTGLARLLDIDERLVRRYASGQEKLPRVVRLAIERLIELHKAKPPQD
jgi:ribosome-binding protein aMBF1 (putative translation factor)